MAYNIKQAEQRNTLKEKKRKEAKRAAEEKERSRAGVVT